MRLRTVDAAPAPSDAGEPWLAAVAVFFSLIGAFYYLRVVKIMYFDDLTDRAEIAAGEDVRLIFSVNGLVILALGFLPGTLMSICLTAFTVPIN